jgi:Family of unknown function (DUF5990)
VSDVSHLSSAVCGCVLMALSPEAWRWGPGFGDDRRMRIVLTGVDCPRLPGVTVGVQRGTEAVQPFPAEGSVVTWELDARLVGSGLRGPYVHGRPGGRFLYLSWQMQESGRFRRAKLMLDVLPFEHLQLADQGHLAARVSLVMPDGSPVCAAVRPPRIEWSAVGG